MSVVHVSWLLLLVVGGAAIGLVGLIRVLASPRSGPVAKVLGLGLLTVLGLLLLAFVVLTVSYRDTRVQGPRIPTAVQVDAPAGAKVSVSPSGVFVKSGRGRHVAVTANGVTIPEIEPPPAAAPSDFVRAPDHEKSSQTAGVLGALNRALAAAARSWVAKSESAPPQSKSEWAPVDRSPQARPPVETSSVSKTPALKRPDWVANPPQPSAEVYELVVKAGPWETPLECERQLDEKITWAVDSYVAWRIGEEASSQLQLPADYAREHLVKEQPWVEKVNTSVGEMYNVYALLQFDRQVEGKLQDLWDQIRLGTRLLLSAAVLAGALLILTVIYGYLKVDLATGGAYRGRLRFVAVATILALAAAGAAVCRRWPS